jgi:hypothetical protein
MAEKTLQRIKDSILTQYKTIYPDEKINGKVFSGYILDKYARLLLKIYQKAKK